MRFRAVSVIFTATVISLLSISCSSGPNGPEPGTPGFYWASAKQTYASGDFLKTSENLDRAMKSAEFAPKGAPWALVLDAGLVRGYMDLSDNLEQGAKANRTNPAFFRKQMTVYRRAAKQFALLFIERFQKFEITNKDEQIALTFPFPSGTQAQPPLMGKIVQGIIPPEAELEDAQKLQLARAVILETTAAVGAGDDSSKAQQMFKAGEVKEPRATFLLAMADALNSQALLFGPKKLDEPDKLKMFAQEAMDALKGLPDSKAVKALSGKIQKTLKPDKKTT